MKEVTMFVKGVDTAPEIQDVEQILSELAGVERVLTDTEDGEIKIKYDDTKISIKHMAISLQQHDYQIGL